MSSMASLYSFKKAVGATAIVRAASGSVLFSTFTLKERSHPKSNVTKEFEGCSTEMCAQRTGNIHCVSAPDQCC